MSSSIIALGQLRNAFLDISFYILFILPNCFSMNIKAKNTVLCEFINKFDCNHSTKYFVTLNCHGNFDCLLVVFAFAKLRNLEKSDNEPCQNSKSSINCIFCYFLPQIIRTFSWFINSESPECEKRQYQSIQWSMDMFLKFRLRK